MGWKLALGKIHVETDELGGCNIIRTCASHVVMYSYYRMYVRDSNVLQVYVKRRRSETCEDFQFFRIRRPNV